MLSGVLNASVEKSPAKDCTSGQSLILTQLSMTLIIFVPLLLCFITPCLNFRCVLEIDTKSLKMKDGISSASQMPARKTVIRFGCWEFLLIAGSTLGYVSVCNFIFVWTYNVSMSRDTTPFSPIAAVKVAELNHMPWSMEKIWQKTIISNTRHATKISFWYH